MANNCLSILLAPLFIFLEALNVASADDFSYLKACYPWFRPPEHKPEVNCTLRCSLHMPFLGVSGREAAICLGDGTTGIVCSTDKECQNIVDTSYCKQAFCLCEERGVERFYSFITKSDSSVGFCTTLSEWHSGHVPLSILFPWKTFMIVFGTLVLTGLFLMAVKWASPLLNTLREEYRLSSSRDRGVHSAADSTGSQVPNSPVLSSPARDKPPSYETAIQLGELPPSYETAQQLHAAANSTTTQDEVPTNDDANPASSVQQHSNATPLSTPENPDSIASQMMREECVPKQIDDSAAPAIHPLTSTSSDSHR